jgi:hypothetical protein
MDSLLTIDVHMDYVGGDDDVVVVVSSSFEAVTCGHMAFLKI